MFKTILQPNKIHGLFFDGAVFFGNIAFIGYLPRLGDEVAPATAGGLLLVAVLTQMAGALWKKGFLAHRRARQERLPPDGLARGFMDLLLLLHFLLFSMMTLFAFALLGIYDMSDSGNIYKGDIWVIIAFVVGGYTTSLVRAAEQNKEVSTGARSELKWLEFGADGLLWISVSIVTRIFWGGLVKLIEPSRGIGISGQGIILLLAMSFLYTFFYLPSRYLFLVEDYRSALTWVQVWGAMLPVILFVTLG